MKAQWIAMTVMGACAIGCGGGDDGGGPVDEPANPERPLPAKGGPDGEEFDVPDEIIELNPGSDDPDVGVAEPGACCNTTFRILDVDGSEDEVRVELVGTEAPLSTPVELEFDSGIWSGDACIPPAYGGTYHYRFVYDDGQNSAVLQAHNPVAPTIEIGGAVYNDWIEAGACEDTFSELHAEVE